MPTSDASPRRWWPLLACLLLLPLAGCTAYHRALKDGEAALQAGQYEAAEQAYQLALAADPRSQEAQAGLAKVRRAWALELVARGDAAKQAGELGQAADAYARAASLDASNPEAPERLRQTLEARAAQGHAAVKAGELVVALAHFEAVLRHDAQHTSARMGQDRVHAEWARQLFARATAYEQDGKLGNALVEYVRADQERPGATPARERAAALRERLRDEVAYWVEMPPVEDRAGFPDVAGRLAAGHITAALPTGVPIRVVTQSPKGGVGVRLSVALERVWSQKDVETSQRTKTYVAGTRAVVNGRRGEAEVALLELERDAQDLEAQSTQLLRNLLRASGEATQAQELLERCRERAREECAQAFADCARAGRERQPGEKGEAAVTSACRADRCSASVCAQEGQALSQRRGEAEQLRGQLERLQTALDQQRRKVERSRDAMVREPLTVEEPMEAEFIYDVELHRLKVHATVTTRLEELFGDGAPTVPFTREHVVESEDTTHQGHEKVSVLADPLALRTEAELRNAVGEKAALDVASLVRARFDAYRAKRVQAAQRGMVRAGAEDVVETTVRALLLTADAPPQELTAPLAAARRISDPLALVRGQ
jgi:tetratricopeptide (TPR) repeat protein